MGLTEIVSLVGGVIGGLYALVELIVRFVHWTQRRGRIALVSTRVQYYVRRYEDAEVERAIYLSSGQPLSPAAKDALRNRPQRAFTIVEFVLQNTHEHPISVGRLMLDDWIYADRWTLPMYGPERDYRAYDLYSKERVDLAANFKLDPADLLGRRIEVVETAHGPDLISNHVYASVSEHRSFRLTVHCQNGDRVFNIPVPGSIPEYGFDGIFRWSGNELLDRPQITTGSLPPP